MYPREKYELERQEEQKVRIQEKTDRINEHKRQEARDINLRAEAVEKANEKYLIKKNIEYQQYLQEESAIKDKQMYDYEHKQGVYKQRALYEKKHELTGADLGKIALQRQKETEFLSDKKIRRENALHKAWKESERIRVARETEERRIKKLEDEAKNKESFSTKQNLGMDIHKLYGIKKKPLMELYENKHY